jgi:hypothetical protein
MITSGRMKVYGRGKRGWGKGLPTNSRKQRMKKERKN